MYAHFFGQKEKNEKELLQKLHKVIFDFYDKKAYFFALLYS